MTTFISARFMCAPYISAHNFKASVVSAQFLCAAQHLSTKDFHLTCCTHLPTCSTTRALIKHLPSPASSTTRAQHVCRLGGTLRGVRAQGESAFEAANLIFKSEGQATLSAVSDGLQRVCDARQYEGVQGCCFSYARQSEGVQECCWRVAQQRSTLHAAVPVAAVERCAEARSTQAMHLRVEQQLRHLAVGAATSKSLLIFSVATVEDRGASRRLTAPRGPRARERALEREGPPTYSPVT